MKTYKTLHLLHIILTLSIFFTISIAQQAPTSFCDKIRTQTPSFVQNSVESSLLNRMILCKSQKLYFRTSLGLFRISSINYTGKAITISHSACSSSSHLVSPSLLSAGFPTPQPNLLLLFNCSNQRYPMPPFIRNCSRMHNCGPTSEIQKQELAGSTPCLLVDEPENLYEGFDPKALNCSHYSRVFRNSSDDEDTEEFEFGTRISFEIPDHVPNICDECEKPNGNCGVALRCICHPKECKEKVFSMAISRHPLGNVLCSLLSFVVVMVGFMDS